MAGDFVFVNYDGPKLGDEQQALVRSTVVLHQEGKGRSHVGGRGGRASAGDGVIVRFNSRTGREYPRKEMSVTRTARPAKMLRELGQPHGCVQPETGMPAKLYQHYSFGLDEGCALIVEAFSVVGFTGDIMFQPDKGSRLTMQVSWLFANSVLDSTRRGTEIDYPREELAVLQELNKLVALHTGQATPLRPNNQLVKGVCILALFECIRGSPHGLKHLSALRQLVKQLGGIEKVQPLILRDTIVYTNFIYASCFDVPIWCLPPQELQVRLRLRLHSAGKFFPNSPIMMVDDDGFASLHNFIDADSAALLGAILQDAFEVTEELVARGPSSLVATRTSSSSSTPEQRRPLAPNPAVQTIVESICETRFTIRTRMGVLLQTCALCYRIFFRSLESRSWDCGGENLPDMRLVYSNLQFLGLEAWEGLPYVYIWVLVVGLATGTKVERPLFTGQIVVLACAFGKHHEEMFSRLVPTWVYIKQGLVSNRDVNSRSIDDAGAGT